VLGRGVPARACQKDLNTDGNGNVKVHEQGTANTAVTAYPRASVVHEGGGHVDNTDSYFLSEHFPTINASTIVLTTSLSVTGNPCSIIYYLEGGNPESFQFVLTVRSVRTVTIPLPEPSKSTRSSPIRMVPAKRAGRSLEARAVRPVGC
jgi:hypothetical protein